MNCVLCQTILCLCARKSARCLIEMIESMATSTLLRYRFKAHSFFYVCTPPELLSTFLFCALQQRDVPSSQDMKGKQKSRSSRFDKFLKMILKSFQKKKKDSKKLTTAKKKSFSSHLLSLQSHITNILCGELLKLCICRPDHRCNQSKSDTCDHWSHYTFGLWDNLKWI